MPRGGPGNALKVRVVVLVGLQDILKVLVGNATGRYGILLPLVSKLVVLDV